jgi:hypothetical protein
MDLVIRMRVGGNTDEPLCTVAGKAKGCEGIHNVARHVHAGKHHVDADTDAVVVHFRVRESRYGLSGFPFLR